MAEDPTAGGESDAESVYGDDEDALGWYAAAAADDGEASEGEEETTELPQEEESTVDDPYLAATDDPYGAVSDPYGAVSDPYGDVTTGTTVAEVAPTPTVSVPSVTPFPSSTSTHADIVGPDGAKISERLAARRAARRAAAVEADASAPWRQPPKKVQKTQAQVTAPPPSPSIPSTAAPMASSPLLPSATSTPTPPPPMPSLTPSTPQVTPTKSPLASQSPPPAPPMPEVSKEIDVNMTSTTDVNITSTSDLPKPEPLEPVVEEVPALNADVAMDDEVQTVPEVVAVDDMTWDEKVVVVKQGQLYIEMQRRNPPMPDSTLMTFCDWLDAQMPLVVSSFPYIKKSGAYVDLSDNLIGPDGLDKLFRVLRDHRVPCVVIKAFRNLLDDSIVDTLVEYLYTQPEAFPMHGIHMSHNNITDKGAFRLVQAAAKCGHYPRLTSRLPLWLRLECNNVFNPQKVILDSNQANFNVCLMGNGMCSRPDCNHYSGVHVQLPYFFHQQTPGNEQERLPKSAPMQPPVNMYVDQPSQAVNEDISESDGSDLLSIYRTEVPATHINAEPPDWKRKERLANTMQAAMMVPAPKRQDFTPAPKRQLAPQSKAMASHSKAMGSKPPSFGTVEDSSGFVPLVSEDWQVSSPYLDNTVIGDEFASNGTFGDGDLAAGGPSCGKKGFGKGKICKGWNDGKGWKNKDNFGGKGWKNDKKGGWKGNAWEHDTGSGGFQQPPWGQDNFEGCGKDGMGKGGKGKGKRGVYWQGPSLMVKVKKDIQLMDGDVQLGFMWQYQGDGIAPRVTHVDFGSKVSQAAEAGCSLLRMNGLDATMLTEKQITDLLKSRPLALRFGDQ